MKEKHRRSYKGMVKGKRGGVLKLTTKRRWKKRKMEINRVLQNLGP